MSAVIAPDVSCAGLGGAVDEAYRQFCEGYRGLLVAIAEHDRCEAYKVLGVRSESDYLRRTFDLGWYTARDWSREARLVGTHPEIGDSLATGHLSVDKFRKMAELVDHQSPESVKPTGPFGDDRPAGPDPAPHPDADSGPDGQPDPDGDYGPDGSGGEPAPGDFPTDPSPEPETSARTLEELMAMLEQLTQQQLAAKAAEARAEAARRRDRHRTRHLDVTRADGEGRLTIKTGALFDEDAAIVWAAFEDYANRVGKNPETGTWDPRGMRHADALRAMADAYLARRERELGHPLVVFHADARILSGDDNTAWAAAGADHSPLSVDAIGQLVCSSRINLALDDPDGNPLFLGRTQRLASWQQEYMVIWRDGACRACGSTVGLQTHHLQEWTAEHGLTDVDAMIAACTSCHHLQHAGGWRFDGDPNREIRFLDPTGNVRCRSNPHPRFEARPRPPKHWLTDPPPETDNQTTPVEPPPDDKATLW